MKIYTTMRNASQKIIIKAQMLNCLVRRTEREKERQRECFL